MNNVLHYGDKLLLNSPDHAKELFAQFSQVANGKPADAVLSAAVNVLVNALRQAYGTRREVEARFDELMGKSKAALMLHYDGTTGRRVSTIPFNQSVVMPHVDARLGRKVQ